MGTKRRFLYRRTAIGVEARWARAIVGRGTRQDNLFRWMLFGRGGGGD